MRTLPQRGGVARIRAKTLDIQDVAQRRADVIAATVGGAAGDRSRDVVGEIEAQGAWPIWGGFGGGVSGSIGASQAFLIAGPGLTPVLKAKQRALMTHCGVEPEKAMAGNVCRV